MSQRLYEEWSVFHEAHPEVGEALRLMALRLKVRGVTRWGIANLWEVLRFNTRLGADVPEEDIYQLNNNHKAYYARWLMSTFTSLEGFFEIRALNVDVEEEAA